MCGMFALPANAKCRRNQSSGERDPDRVAKHEESKRFATHGMREVDHPCMVLGCAARAPSRNPKPGVVLAKVEPELPVSRVAPHEVVARSNLENGRFKDAYCDPILHCCPAFIADGSHTGLIPDPHRNLSGARVHRTEAPYTVVKGIAMRSWTVVLACCWAGAVSAQLPADPRLDQSLTVQLRAAPVARIVAQIGDKVGMPLKASPSMWQEIILVNVKDVKATALLSRIAQQTSGQWKNVEGVMTLTRDPKATARDAKEDLARRTALLKTEMTGRRAALTIKLEAETYLRENKALSDAMQKATGPLSPELLTRSIALNMAQPDQRLITRLCSLVGLQELAAIGPNERVVWSNLPTRMQRPLGSFMPAISAYAEENASWLEIQRKLSDRAMEEAKGDDLEGEGIVPEMTVPPRPAVRVLLAVARPGDIMSGGLSVSAMFLDDAGRTVMHVFGNLLNDVGSPTEPATYAKSLTGPIEFSAESKKLNEVMRLRFSDGDTEGKITDQTVLDRVLRPEEFDPLDSGCSDALFSVSKALDRNIVAVVPDVAGFFFLFAGEREMTVGSFLDQMIAARILRLKEDGDWLEIMPDDLTLARRMRADRAVLGKFVRLAYEKSNLSLDDTAAFCASHEDAPFSSISLFTMMMVLGDRIATLGSGNWQMLSLWGRLTADQKRILRGGGQLSLGSLSSRQIDLVRQMVFGAEGRIDQDLSDLAAAKADDEEGPSALASEPTEALPNGLQANGTISMSPTQFDLFAVKTHSETGQEIETNEMPESVAWRLFARERPDLFPWATAFADEDRFRLGTMNTMNFTFRFAPKVMLREDLRDSSVPNSGPWLKYEQLPEATRTRITALIEQQRQQYAGVKAGEGGSEEKPPPRR